MVRVDPSFLVVLCAKKITKSWVSCSGDATVGCSSNFGFSRLSHVSSLFHGKLGSQHGERWQPRAHQRHQGPNPPENEEEGPGWGERKCLAAGSCPQYVRQAAAPQRQEGPEPTQPSIGEEGPCGQRGPALLKELTCGVWEGELTPASATETIPASTVLWGPSSPAQKEGGWEWPGSLARPSGPTRDPSTHCSSPSPARCINNIFPLSVGRTRDSFIKKHFYVGLWLKEQQKAKTSDFHITVKIKFPLDSQQQHPESRKVNMYFLLVLSHFPLLCVKKPLFCAAGRKALRGNACKSAGPGEWGQRHSWSHSYRSPLMSARAAAANGGASGVKGKCGRRLSTQGASQLPDCPEPSGRGCTWEVTESNEEDSVPAAGRNAAGLEIFFQQRLQASTKPLPSASH